MQTKSIKLNKDLSIDTAKLLQSRMVILANSGGGKSYAIRKFAEEASGQVQTIIIDPEGEFASLREKFDFILSGKNADVPAEVRSAGLLATRLLELGNSAVIDLYELHPQERQRFVKTFFDAMINAPKELYHPVFIILDEAHEYAPEGKPSEATWAVEAMASRGRKRGFCLIPASQRISKLSKNVSAECNNKLIGRASQDIDMKRAGDELGFGKDRMVELRQLKPGEFFAFGPAISDEIQKIKIGEVKTHHAKVGYHGTVKVPPPSAVIKKILAEIKDLPQEAVKEAQTVVELKAEIKKLKSEHHFKVSTKYEPDLKATEKAVTIAVKEALRVSNQNRDAELFEWQTKWLEQIQNWFLILKTLGEEMAQHKKMIEKRKSPLRIDTYKTDYVKLLGAMPGPKEQNFYTASPAEKERRQNDIENLKINKDMQARQVAELGIVVLNAGEREILMAIAQHNGITTEHIAVLTGYKQTSRREYLRKLIAKGYLEPVDSNGDYVATDEGKAALGDFVPLPTGHDLIHHYKATLPEGEKKLFEAMLLQAPNPVDRATLEHETNYKTTSVREYMRKLVARKVVVQEGNLYKLSELLID